MGGALSIALLDLHLLVRMVPRDFGKDERKETGSRAKGCWGMGAGDMLAFLLLLSLGLKRPQPLGLVHDTLSTCPHLTETQEPRLFSALQV